MSWAKIKLTERSAPQQAYIKKKEVTKRVRMNGKHGEKWYMTYFEDGSVWS